MLDPFPLPPPKLLQQAITPIANYFHLTTLPLHIHEILCAFLLYHFVNTRFSPWFSTRFFPTIYANFNARTRINWDVHVVSMVQSCLINALALWVMFTDDERGAMSASGRVFGYTGACGLIQAFATGYFLWDFVLCATHLDVFGVGLLAHAISALAVFSLGFRPVFNYYGPVFILYELSTPFLNFHWFFDKLDMTGSRPQLYNGMALIASFFMARLCWGTYSTVRIAWDVYQAVFQSSGFASSLPPVFDPPSTAAPGVGFLDKPTDPLDESMRFAGGRTIPIWIYGAYVGANLTLHTLNFYWFGKMIETVRKRFDPPLGTKGLADKKRLSKGDVDRYGDGIVNVSKAVHADGHQSVEVEANEVRNRRRG